MLPIIVKRFAHSERNFVLSISFILFDNILSFINGSLLDPKINEKKSTMSFKIHDKMFMHLFMFHDYK